MEKMTVSDLIELQQGKYRLTRVSDGAGDCGPLLFSFWLNSSTGNIEKTTNGTIKIGCSVECGSIYARMMSYQDFWRTTPITEIVEVNQEKTFVRFKTKNSEYTVEVV